MDKRNFATIRRSLAHNVNTVRGLKLALQGFELPCESYDHELRNALGLRRGLYSRLNSGRMATVTPAEAGRIQRLFSRVDGLVLRMRLAFDLAQRLVVIDAGIERSLGEIPDRPQQVVASDQSSRLLQQFVEYVSDPQPLVQSSKRSLDEARQALRDGRIEEAEEKALAARAFATRETLLRSLLRRNQLVAA